MVANHAWGYTDAPMAHPRSQGISADLGPSMKPYETPRGALPHFVSKNRTKFL